MAGVIADACTLSRSLARSLVHPREDTTGVTRQTDYQNRHRDLNEEHHPLLISVCLSFRFPLTSPCRPPPSARQKIRFRHSGNVILPRRPPNCARAASASPSSSSSPRPAGPGSDALLKFYRKLFLFGSIAAAASHVQAFCRPPERRDASKRRCVLALSSNFPMVF